MWEQKLKIFTSLIVVFTEELRSDVKEIHCGVGFKTGLSMSQDLLRATSRYLYSRAKRRRGKNKHSTYTPLD